jgi:uncharacterized membrane protein YbhN (UPF0104 family)
MASVSNERVICSPYSLAHASRWVSQSQVVRGLGVGVALAALAAILLLYDVGHAMTELSLARPFDLAVAFGLILASLAIAFLRFRATVSIFGFQVPVRTAARAFVVGQFSNQFLANIFGQSISRAAVLQTSGVPFSVTVFATWIERIFALGSLLALSVLGVIFVFGRFVLDLSLGGAYLLSVLICIAVAMAVAAAIVLLRHRGELAQGWTLAHGWKLLAVAALTLAIHTTTLLSYMTALSALGVETGRLDVAAALIIVMFTTSLPISFGGWGIRELSSAHALGLVGIAAPAAIAGAVLIGILAAAAMALMVLALVSFNHSNPVKGVAASSEALPAEFLPVAAHGWDELLLWCCSLLAAGLIFFQIKVPLAVGEVNVNPADLVALTALGIGTAAAVTSRSLGVFGGWFWRGLLVLSIVMGAGLIWGYAAWGWTDWAFINRGLGWLVILGYAVAGSAAGMAFGRTGRDTVLMVLVSVGVVILAGQFALLEVDRFFVSLPGDVLSRTLDGYAGNSNAFAVQVLAVMVAGAALFWTGALSRTLAAVLLTITLLGLWEIQSRMGLALGLTLMLAIVMATPSAQRKDLVKSVAVALVVTVAIYAAMNLIMAYLTAPDANNALAKAMNRSGILKSVKSDAERWQTIIDGLKLWLSAPVFGVGLGGYVAERTNAGLSYQIIHSIPVWLLAEFGLVGLVLVGSVVVDWTQRAFAALARPSVRLWALCFLALLAIIGTGGLVHDLAFQRMFWFLASLFAAAMIEAGRMRPAGVRTA